MATASSLGVWLDGIRVADLEQPRWPRIRLRYSEEALDRWPQNSLVPSCSLPLSRTLDLTTVEVERLELGGHDCLIVSRFDRAAADDREVRRIHQEDLCQALGLDPTGTRGRAKYEQARAGPSPRQLADGALAAAASRCRDGDRGSGRARCRLGGRHRA